MEQILKVFVISTGNVILSDPEKLSIPPDYIHVRASWTHLSV